jgi:transaldolase
MRTVLLLDSALPDDARRAASLGYVQGATTNPTLIARSGLSPFDAIRALLDTLRGPVFYQPVGDTVDALVQDARLLLGYAPDRLRLKIPCTPAGLAAVALLRQEDDDLEFGVTAVFTPAQVAVASAAGARYALPYFNRIERLAGDAAGAIRRMADVGAPCGVELIVASIKSPDEAVAALLAGAKHLTLPLDVLEAMIASPLTDAAMDEFAKSALMSGAEP